MLLQPSKAKFPMEVIFDKLSVVLLLRLLRFVQPEKQLTGMDWILLGHVTLVIREQP